jgi:hypothetical protein
MAEACPSPFLLRCSIRPPKEVQAIAAIIRDETDRWEQERALRQRLAELEAKNR